jgi:hypothetical protein
MHGLVAGRPFVASGRAVDGWTIVRLAIGCHSAQYRSARGGHALLTGGTAANHNRAPDRAWSPACSGALGGDLVPLLIW